MKTSVERLVTSAFIAVLVLLCASALVAHVAKDAVVTGTRAAHRDRAVLQSLANLRTAILMDESAGRGFAATGDDSFLRRDAAAQARALAELEFLREELRAEQPDEHDEASLPTLVAARFARTQAIVAARRHQGRDAAASLIATRQGLQLTDAILDACAGLETAVEARLDEAEHATEDRARTVSFVSTLASVSGAATVLLASLLIRARVLAARSERQLMASVVDLVHAADEAIIGKSLDGTVRSWNVGAEKLYGWAERDMVGSSIQRVVPEDRVAELHAALARVGAGERVGPLETDRVRRDGGRIRVSLNLTPIRDASGRVAAIATIARDMTATGREAADRDAMIAALRAAASRSLALSQLLPTCAWCKAVRDDGGAWKSLDAFLREAADVQFTHGICPDCVGRLKA